MNKGYWIFKDTTAQCNNCKIKLPSALKPTPFCPYCGIKMTNYNRLPCSSYRILNNGVSVCYGTKERDACDCNGDQRNCTFYDYIRQQANSNS